MDNNESLEVRVARIDENVRQIKNFLPLVKKHDNELLIAKVLIGVALFTIAISHPLFADLISRVIK